LITRAGGEKEGKGTEPPKGITDGSQALNVQGNGNLGHAQGEKTQTHRKFERAVSQHASTSREVSKKRGDAGKR